MNNGFYSIRFDDKELSNYRMSNGKEREIEPLGRLNIFVGTNNSGKSRFLRGLLKTREYNYTISGLDYHNIQNIAAILKPSLLGILDGAPLHDVTPNGGSSLRKSIEQINPDAMLGSDTPLISALKFALKNIELSTLQSYTSSSGRINPGPPVYPDMAYVVNGLWEAIRSHKALIESLEEPENFKPEKIYVPVLRGLRPAPNSTEDIYNTRTVRDYFIKEDGSGPIEDIQVFTGLTLYEEIKRHLLGTLVQRKLVSDYEKYLSERFFEHKPVTLIPKIDCDVLIIKVGQEFEKEIFNVGDGLQSLIAITFPIFRFAREHKDKFAIVCIEEPELLIHPGLQRTLMNELVRSGAYDNIQFFVTTHSNHFLDLTLDFDDVSIFRVSKELPEDKKEEQKPKFIIENLSNKDKQTLELLGVRNSSVFLANATIWVEGITDRMYFSRALEIIQNSLEKDQKRYREDDHYAFVEYGGANISHWDFVIEGDVDQIPLESIVSKIFVIADNDSDVVDATGARVRNGHNKKQERLRAIHERFGDERFVQFDRREIENLIPIPILRKVAARLGSTNASVVPLSYREYKSARMGTFMEEKFGLTGFAGNYGAIKNKKKFAELVVKEMKSLDDLSPEMKQIAEKMLTFVTASNS